MCIRDSAHLDQAATWQTLFALLKERDVATIDPILIYYIAHIPWHGDINAPRNYAPGTPLSVQLRKDIESWGRPEIEKLLWFVDNGGFNRGTLGQSVDAIVRVINTRKRDLREIARAASVPIEVRKAAV